MPADVIEKALQHVEVRTRDAGLAFMCLWLRARMHTRMHTQRIDTQKCTVPIVSASICIEIPTQVLINTCMNICMLAGTHIYTKAWMHAFILLRPWALGYT